MKRKKHRRPYCMNITKGRESSLPGDIGRLLPIHPHNLS